MAEGLPAEAPLRGAVATSEDLERQRHALDTAQALVWDWNIVTGDVVCAGPVDEMFGISPLSRIEAFLNLVHPADRSRFQRMMEDTAAHGDAPPCEFQFRIMRPDGVERWLEARGRIAVEESGRPVRASGLVLDITDRYRNDEALRASEIRYRTLVSQAKEYAIFALDLEGRAVSWNEGVERVLGYSREEFLEMPVTKLYLEEDIAQGIPQKELDASAKHGEANDDRWMRRKDGSAFFASGMTMRLEDSQGRMFGYSKVLRDQTQQKETQEARERLLASERAARTAVETADRLKDEFLATLSHELRTPLNAVLGWASVLAKAGDRLPEAERRAGLLAIERNARLQADMIEDLLDMRRIVSGKVRLELANVKVQTVIRNAVAAIRPEAEARGVHLESELQPEVPPIYGDAARVQQVLWNLLTNAVKFTPAGGTVRVKLEGGEEEARITVQDTGQGIAREFLPYVFEQFRQADASAARRQGGLGLGLAIVKQLVDLHGGSVSVDSGGVGHGTTFTVTLPVSAMQPASAPEETEAAGEDEGPQVTAPEALAGLKVLAVDDDEDARELIRRVLEEHQATVVTASSGAEALRLLAETRPDVIISDIGMPELDGYEFVRALRALPADRGGMTPAIALTAFARSEDRAQAFNAGYQEHVRKPVIATELIAAVASLASDGASHAGR